MKTPTRSVEFIQERFQEIGLGAYIPSTNNHLTRLGDHIHWLDLIGNGLFLSKVDARVATELLELYQGGPIAGDVKAWYPLLMPIDCEDPVTFLLQAGMHRGFRDEKLTELFEFARRAAVRNPSLQPIVLQAARQIVHNQNSGICSQPGMEAENNIGVWMCCVELGDLSDLEFLCGNLAAFKDFEQIRIVFEVHMRGWHWENCYLEALEQLPPSPPQTLHEALIVSRQGGSPADLEDWIVHPFWLHRFHALKAIHRIFPEIEDTEALLELLLPRLEHEKDRDCYAVLSWVLGKILEQSPVSAALKVVKALVDHPEHESVGFRSGLRALIRTKLSIEENEILLRAMEPLFSLEYGLGGENVGLVRLHLNQAPVTPWDLIARFSCRSGWLQDLAEPGRQWDGLVGQFLEGTVDPQIVVFLCFESTNDLPIWLRTLWLAQLMERDGRILAVAEKALRNHKSENACTSAAQALLLYPGEVQADPLYLACLSQGLPRTMAKDSLRNAIHLMKWSQDRLMNPRVEEFLSGGGSLCREVERYWCEAKLYTDNTDEAKEAVQRLLELGVQNPPRTDVVQNQPLGRIPSLMNQEGSWEAYLVGDLRAMNPEVLALRLEFLNPAPLLLSVCKELAKLWPEKPENVLTAWEVLNEHIKTRRRLSALFAISEVDASFLQGRAGERRRDRLLEMTGDGQSNVAQEADKICHKLGIKKAANP